MSIFKVDKTKSGQKTSKKAKIIKITYDVLNFIIGEGASAIAGVALGLFLEKATNQKFLITRICTKIMGCIGGFFLADYFATRAQASFAYKVKKYCNMLIDIANKEEEV